MVSQTQVNQMEKSNKKPYMDVSDQGQSSKPDILPYGSYLLFRAKKLSFTVSSTLYMFMSIATCQENSLIILREFFYNLLPYYVCSLFNIIIMLQYHVDQKLDYSIASYI